MQDGPEVAGNFTWPSEATAKARTADDMTTNGLFSGGLPCNPPAPFCMTSEGTASERHSSVNLRNGDLSFDGAMAALPAVSGGLLGLAMAATEAGTAKTQLGRLSLDMATCAPGHVPVLVQESAKEDANVVAFSAGGEEWLARCVQPMPLALNNPTAVCAHPSAFSACHISSCNPRHNPARTCRALS